jgi:hypothetical protein
MASVTVEVGRDGIPRIHPLDRPLPPADRYVAIFTVLMAAAGLVIATAMPPQALGMAAGCCAAAEISVRLRELSRRRGPPAEVRELGRRRGRA